jgi:YVTN family beta-propeller protein
MEPNGARAYVAISSDNSIAVVDLKTLEVTRRIPSGANPEGMAWAP